LGELVTEQLDEMKGLAMKLGQIVSYMDVPLPEVVQERMARLQAGTTGLSESDTRAALCAALGADWESRFDSFDIVPIAAASIGQVHRARYQGRDIALKLQYPQASGGFEKDLSAMGRIASLASLASAVDGPKIVAELAARLEEECDYASEARHQAAFRRAFAQDAVIHIPEVIDDLCGRTTLATTWAQGADAREARTFSQNARNQIGEALVRFSYRSLLEICAIQADPHPGNFLFLPSGTVVCLDFGCVRAFESEFVSQLREMIRAIDETNHARFEQIVIALGMAPRPQKFDFSHYFSMMEHLHRPLLASRFRFTSEYVKQGLAYNGPTSPNARTMDMPPAYIWVARLQWGLWSLLARLDVEVELRDWTLELLQTQLQPLEV
jgi:predicted unusual protein kinase regulating ubiquinone biosynthesis (AarF/ABC1/UbiB family)